MKPEMKVVYCDEDGYKQFMGYLLEEQTESPSSTTEITDGSLTRIIEGITEMKKGYTKTI